MLVRGAFSPGEVAELEDHLLEEAGRLAEEGRPDEEAFIEATRRMGTGEELVGEFRLGHELGGASASVWLGRCVPWALRLCRWARCVFLFCLPGLGMAVPWAMVDRMLRREWFAHVIPGVPVPLATAVGWRVVDFACANWWWLLPLGFVTLVAPTVSRVRQARLQADASVATILADELGEAQPLVLAGLAAYPLIGMAAPQVLLAPLFKLIGALGG
jgi:hypothetical protein